MIRAIALVATAAATVALAGASAPARTDSNASFLDALDPTRFARLTCGRGGDDDATLERRLALAAARADALGMGRGAMPLYDDVAPSQIPASGLDGTARRYFDQGLALAYGFNHVAAIRAFRMACDLAPECAMCWWGEAMASGPNINAPLSPQQNADALAALAEARRLAVGAGALETALIAAQELRYSAGEGADRAALDVAYADAMMALSRDNPGNDDIAILAAEAAMNTTPWSYWNEEKAPVNPRIGEAIALIEKVMARSPAHPQASHLYIHLMENSADPTRGEAAADRLVRSAPSALGHLVHMPGHIFHRIGRYGDSLDANIAAARADERYLAAVGDDGLYRFGYYPHNVHFLLTSAQMIGNMKAVSGESVRLARLLDVETARALPWVQAIHAAPAFAIAQYGTPEAILALTATPSDLNYVEAMRRYARASAYARLRDDDRFAGEIAAMDAIAASDEVQAMTKGGFPASDLVTLARLVAQARQAQSAGRPMDAVALYEQAEAIEKSITYSEPAYWYYPVAQSRGAALYAAGRYEDARDAFRKALSLTPNSSWALYGLAETERRLGHRAEAQAARAALQRHWQGEAGWLRMDRL